MELLPEVKENRVPENPVAPEFLNRWSPYAFSSQPIADDVLNSLFEAARWAASSYNEQPWRFLVAKTPEDHAKFLALLVDANQAWAKVCPVLVITLAKKTFSHNGQTNGSYVHDTGAASAYMALAAAQHGLHAHGMAGFDRDAARTVLGVPDDYDVVAAWALGYKGENPDLPEGYRERDTPSGRRPLWEIVMEGSFKPVPPDDTQEK